MDRKSLPLYEKPHAYAPPATPSTTEILLLAEAIIETDKLIDSGSIPAIVFRKPGGGRYYTYKKLTGFHHALQDKYRCCMHLVAVNPYIYGGEPLAELLSRQVVSRESEGKWGDRVEVEVKRILIVWKGEESGMQRHNGGEYSKAMCVTNVMGMREEEMGRVWRRMEMRGWVDRLVVVYGVL